MAGEKSATEKKVYIIGGEEVTDLKQITLSMIERHVMELGKKDAEWYVKFAETKIEKEGKDGKKVKRVPTYIETRNEFARKYFPDLAPKGTTKKADAMKETLARLKAFIAEEE